MMVAFFCQGVWAGRNRALDFRLIRVCDRRKQNSDGCEDQRSKIHISALSLSNKSNLAPEHNRVYLASLNASSWLISDSVAAPER